MFAKKIEANMFNEQPSFSYIVAYHKPNEKPVVLGSVDARSDWEAADKMHTRLSHEYPKQGYYKARRNIINRVWKGGAVLCR